MASHRQLQAEVRTAAEKISRYLESRPSAVDNLEGIIHWWLLKQQIADSTEVVQAAIDHLVSCGLVQQIKLNGKTFYASAGENKNDGTDDKLTKTS
jgi:hypothetical protein